MAQSRKQLTAPDKAHIAGLYRGGIYSYEDIARMYNRSKTMIMNAVKLFDEDNQCARRNGSGRPRKLHDQDERHIHLLIKRDRYISCSQIKRDLNLDVSVSTINRRIVDSDEIYSGWTQAKPWISKENRIKRVNWCKEHLEWIDEYWRKVLSPVFIDPF